MDEKTGLMVPELGRKIIDSSIFETGVQAALVNEIASKMALVEAPKDSSLQRKFFLIGTEVRIKNQTTIHLGFH